MEVYRRPSWLLLLLGLALLAVTLQGVQGEVEAEGPSESECRPYIEKALKELEGGENEDSAPIGNADSREDIPTVEITTDDSDHPGDDRDIDADVNNDQTDSNESGNDNEPINESNEDNTDNQDDNEHGDDDDNDNDSNPGERNEDESEERNDESEEKKADKSDEQDVVADANTVQDQSEENSTENREESDEKQSNEADDKQSNEANDKESDEAADKRSEENVQDDSKEEAGDKRDTDEGSKESDTESKETVNDSRETDGDSKEKDNDSKQNEDESKEAEGEGDRISKRDVQQEEAVDADSNEGSEETDKPADSTEGDDESNESAPVEELTDEFDAFEGERRPRDHVEQLLKLDSESTDAEIIVDRVSEITLRDLKRLYENAIQPLETVYKYRDLSNRHFGDSEIFSKPLVLFMGPWSGGKSSIINYLVDNEYTDTSLRTGAEPSPAYFNILMWGNESEVLDGTELAADFTFSGLQKFGQGLEERLRGYKLPKKLLEKINIVEIPGILEVRKQVSRVFPFNDACQWFIDRADIIFLVYDPSKLDVGPETEAILDQLKGREQHTRIVLNKADQVKPEELMRVQGALIWNISPLMSSPQPPIMYTTSLWSRPYEIWAPIRLLQAQERAFLRDIRSTIDKRIDNKIASARRFAVRVRNHAKMVDCYLTTYYNHKTVFGNKKHVADEIIEHPQDYHIYEGLSTLTNISRYDLPDPDVYRDFFRLNPLYEFQPLSATCTYFRGCPINRLDVAIAYDLPELVGKHKRLVESASAEAASTTTSTPGTS